MTDLPVAAEHTIHARPRADDAPAHGSAAEDSPAKGLVPDYVRKLAWLLDDAIPLVGKHRIGVDGFLSLVPVVGESVGFGLAAVVVLAGVRAGCTWPTIARMVFHAVGESMVGMIPLAGPAVAFFWKANKRNLRIIEQDLQDREATRRESWKVLVVAGGMVLVGIVFAAVSLVIAAYTIWRWLSG